MALMVSAELIMDSKSYLRKSKQFVDNNRYFQSTTRSAFGKPQGSNLGLILFQYMLMILSYSVISG